MKASLDKIGGIGSLLSALAAAAPCCLPFLASVASAVGLSTLLPYSKYIVIGVQVFAFLASVGAYLSYRKHNKVGPLVLSVLSFFAVVYVYNISLIAWLLYSALSGLVIAAIWNTVETKRCNKCPAPA